MEDPVDIMQHFPEKFRAYRAISVKKLNTRNVYKHMKKVVLLLPISRVFEPKPFSVISIFLTLVMFALSATGQDLASKKIDLNFKDLSLKMALLEVQKQSDIRFVYGQDVNKYSTIKISIVEKDITVQTAIELILKKTNLKYIQEGSNVMIDEKPGAATPKARPQSNRQTKGIIRGKIIDGETEEPLIGASITIEQLSIGATADVHGNFKLDNVPEGIYTISVSFIGYQKSLIHDLQVKEGATTIVNVKLQTSAGELNEVTVTAKSEIILENSTERSLVSEIHESDNIITGISNEQISKSLDRDAGQVVRRVSGVSILNDRFVLIRGMDPRYTLTLLNDMVAPSSESDTRNFSYDMISSTVIDRITIGKSSSPEYTSDYAGGVVKIYTKNSSAVSKLQIQLSAQFRPGSTGKATYGSDNNSKTDWLGFDDGSRAVPKELINGEVPVDPAQNAAFARKLPDNWDLKHKTNSFDKRALINYYDSWLLGKKKLSSLSSLNYTRTSILNRVTNRFFNGENYNDSINQDVARITLLQNFKLSLNERNFIELRGLLNQVGQDETNVRNSVYEQAPPEELAFPQQRRVQYSYRSRGLYTLQMNGDHKVNAEKGSLRWRIGFGRTNESIPDQRRFILARYGTDKGIYNLLLPNYPSTNTVARYYSHLQEDNYTAGLDYVLTKRSITFKSGLYADYRTREFNIKALNYYYDNNNFDPQYNSPKGYNLQYNISPHLGANAILDNGRGIRIYDFSYIGTGNSSYTASNLQYAAYTSASIIKHKLTITPGLRLEHTKFAMEPKVKSSYSFAVDYPTLYLLPSLSAKYELSKKVLLRAGYGMTVNRPQFREAANVGSFDYNTYSTTLGNLDLKNATIQNFDLRGEWYLKPDELISVGIFYKSLSHPIETVTTFDSESRRQISFANADKATVLGAELEIRKKFDFINHSWANHFSVIVNGTYIISQVDLSSQILADPSFHGYGRTTRPLQGTSPYVINAGLYYDNVKIGTQVSMLYNTMGQRLLLTSLETTSSDLYELPRHEFDVSLTQSINAWLQVKVGVQNILNSPFRFYRDGKPDQKYHPPTNPAEDQMERQYKTGAYYSFGINLNF